MSRDDEVSPVYYLLIDGKMHKLDDIRALLAQRASPPAAVAVTDGWIQCAQELPPLDQPVLCLLNWSDSYIWPMMRVDDSDGWLWAMHQHGGLDDTDRYEADDDYLVRAWHPLPAQPAALTTSSAQSAGGLDG